MYYICLLRCVSGDDSIHTYKQSTCWMSSDRIELSANSLQILDEKSLIKKYQKEITSLKTELEQLRRGMMGQPYAVKENSEDLAHLRKQVLNRNYMKRISANYCNCKRTE